MEAAQEIDIYEQFYGGVINYRILRESRWCLKLLVEL